MTAIATWRINLLRAAYGFVIVGLGLILWPSILDPTTTWPLSRGIVVAMLGGFSLLALIGLRHPIRMLPLLFWEIAWKTIWLTRVVLPQSRDGSIDAATTQNAIESAAVVIVLVAIPWDYVWSTYVRGQGERWRGVN